MLRIKQYKFIWFGIIVLGVILLGIPAAVYAGDEPVINEWVGSSDGEVNYDADSTDPPPVLGSTTEDFVFTPVTPCTIVDTRVGGGGFISAGSIRSYNVYGNLVGQGGSNCPSPIGEPDAVLLNVIAVNPNGKGNLNVVPYGVDPRGQGALSVNFNVTAGTNLANAGVVKSTSGGAADISLSANYSGCHAFISVLGYFSRPEKTPLQTDRGYVRTWITGGWGSCIAYCPSGFSLTGGGCNSMSNLMPVQISYPYGNGWRCGATNQSGTSYWLDCHAVCARIPGR